MTLLGGAMWGMNSTVAKLLMRDYQLDPIWLSCVRALSASLIFLVGSAITTPQKLTGAVKDVKSYPKYLVTTLICALLVQVSYLITIDWTNSGTATVLQTLNLVFVLAWVCLRVKRLPLKRELVGVLLHRPDRLRHDHHHGLPRALTFPHKLSDSGESDTGTLQNVS